MLKQIFGSRPTTRTDVGLAVGAVVFAIFKAVDTVNQYKKEQKENES